MGRRRFGICKWDASCGIIYSSPISRESDFVFLLPCQLLSLAWQRRSSGKQLRLVDRIRQPDRIRTWYSPLYSVLDCMRICGSVGPFCRRPKFHYSDDRCIGCRIRSDGSSCTIRIQGRCPAQATPCTCNTAVGCQGPDIAKCAGVPSRLFAHQCCYRRRSSKCCRHLSHRMAGSYGRLVCRFLVVPAFRFQTVGCRSHFTLKLTGNGRNFSTRCRVDSFVSVGLAQGRQIVTGRSE